MSRSNFVEQRSVNGVDDMIMLTNLTDAGILGNLEMRHKTDLIYTNIGAIVVSVNPFKRIPMYTEGHMRLYGSQSHHELPPHIFALADSAFKNMLAEEENQCVIVSGESGAGKTEASKHILNYWTFASNSSSQAEMIKAKLIDSNPILEAFGNAKTLRNNNSSRFGKYLSVQFTVPAGLPFRGNIDTFLLEKSRVVFQSKGERNYHAFYQLLAGGGDQLRNYGLIQNPANYWYLSQSQCYTIDEVDDTSDFKELCAAMETCGIGEIERKDIFTLVGVVLHLGNVKFSEDKHSKATPADPNTVATAAKYMGIDAGLLERILTMRKIKSVREEIDATNNEMQAVVVRDAIAKAIYSRLFDHIVASINQSIYADDSVVDDQTVYACAVLDIYGFEVFQQNGFEQFAINYVNEKLQQIFVRSILLEQQEVYVSEGIKWTPIPFFNNKIVCDLIEGKKPPGIFLLLDDVCSTQHAVSEGSDRALVDKIGQIHAGHEHFIAGSGGFTIKHFAGNVNYTTADFQAKNSDTLSNEVIQAIQTTSNPLLQFLFPDEIDPNSRKRPPTAGSKLVGQCAKLVTQLLDSTPHYCRCIKSNDQKKPNIFEGDRVNHQVKYLNLLESIRVRRAGYAYQNEFHRFIQRFRLLSKQTWPNEHTCSDREACQAILHEIQQRIPIGPEEAQIGKTMIFIKSPEVIEQMEQVKETKIGEMVTRIQRAWIKFNQNKVQIKARQHMMKLLQDYKKERRRESFFRPYDALYWDKYEGTKSAIQKILQRYEGKEKGKDMTQVRVVFAEESERIRFQSSEEREKEKEFAKHYREWLIITQEAVYVIEDQRRQPKVKKIYEEYKKIKKLQSAGQLTPFALQQYQILAGGHTGNLMTQNPAQPGQPGQPGAQGAQPPLPTPPGTVPGQPNSAVPGAPGSQVPGQPAPGTEAQPQYQATPHLVILPNGQAAYVQYLQPTPTKKAPPPVSQLASNVPQIPNSLIQSKAKVEVIASAPKPPVVSTDPARSGKWLRKYDPRYKANYYVDTMRNISQWTVPPDWVEPGSQPPQQTQAMSTNGQSAPAQPVQTSFMPVSGVTTTSSAAPGFQSQGFQSQNGFSSAQPGVQAQPQAQPQPTINVQPKKPPPHFILRRRIPLSKVESLSLSRFADTLLIMHVNGETEGRKVKFREDKTCHICLGPFNNQRVRHTCRACGKSVCSSCAQSNVLLPDFEKVLKQTGVKDPFNTPVRVCDSCVGHDSCERLQDQILKSLRRTEILNVLFALKPSLSVMFQNSIELKFADSKKPAKLVFSRADDDNPDEIIKVKYSEGSIKVVAPQGLGAEFVAKLSEGAAKRRAAAQKRREEEAAYRKQREAERAGEREAARKERIRIKKAKKAETKAAILDGGGGGASAAPPSTVYGRTPNAVQRPHRVSMSHQRAEGAPPPPPAYGSSRGAAASYGSLPPPPPPDEWDT